MCTCIELLVDSPPDMYSWEFCETIYPIMLIEPQQFGRAYSESGETMCAMLKSISKS